MFTAFNYRVIPIVKVLTTEKPFSRDASQKLLKAVHCRNLQNM
jgi:hypothetical protein